MAIDNKLTERVREWLMADDHTSTEDIINGATMLLQLNRNRALFNTIVRRPERYVEKIRYELKKFLPSRLDGMTMNDVERMQGEVLPLVKAAIDEEPGSEAEESDADERPLPLRNGKRADHDSLPEHIQNIWPENAERWKKIKKEYNTCLGLEHPCDRYEHLVSLKEMWYRYKAEFDRYDGYTPGEAEPQTAELSPAELAKKISNAQKFVSKYAAKAAALRDASMGDTATEKDVRAYKDLSAKMRDKIAFLEANNIKLSDKLEEKLRFLTEE